MNNLTRIQEAATGSRYGNLGDRFRLDFGGDVWASIGFPREGQPSYRVWLHTGEPGASLPSRKFPGLAEALDWLCIAVSSG